MSNDVIVNDIIDNDVMSNDVIVMMYTTMMSCYDVIVMSYIYILT